MQVHERLRALRLSKRISQARLGERLGRNQRWISERERGVVVLGADEAIAIARALGFPAEFVILAAADAPLLEVLAHSEGEHTQLALRLLTVLPRLSVDVQKMIGSIVLAAESQAEG